MKLNLFLLTSRLDTTASMAEVCMALNKIGSGDEAIEGRVTTLASGLSG
jgi:hypothetical protein